MDALTTACIVLVLTNISFALLANHWRAALKRQQLQHAIELARTAKHRQRAFADGVTEGLSRGFGLMYAAALKAAWNGEDIFKAMRAVGHINADSEAEEIAA